MAYYHNNVQQPANDGRSSAIDWEAKRIPRLAYENCIQAKEVFLSSLKGNGTEHSTIAKNNFEIAINIFYDTVETEFIKWLKRPTFKAADDKDKQKVRKSIKFDEKELTAEDYLILMDAKEHFPNKKLFLLFQTLKNWCFEEGPLNTYSEGDEDVFERLEREE